MFVTSKINNYQQVKGEKGTWGHLMTFYNCLKGGCSQVSLLSQVKKLQSNGKQPQIALGGVCIACEDNFLHQNG